MVRFFSNVVDFRFSIFRIRILIFDRYCEVVVTSLIHPSLSAPQLEASMFYPPPYIWFNGGDAFTESNLVYKFPHDYRTGPVESNEEADPRKRWRRNTTEIEKLFNVSTKFIKDVLVIYPRTSAEFEERVFYFWLGTKSSSTVRMLPNEIFQEICKYSDVLGEVKTPWYFSHIH